MFWYVVATKSKVETLAKINLEYQGYEVFLPKISKIRKHARKIEKVLKPLFPGYLFVRFNPKSTRWRSINNTIGVKQILSNNGMPQNIKNNFVNELLTKCDENSIYKFSGNCLNKNDCVEIISGAFYSHIGKIISSDNNGRIRMLLKILGQNVIVNSSENNLQKA